MLSNSVTVCSLVNNYWHFGAKEDAMILQTPIYVYQSTWHNILINIFSNSPGEWKISQKLNASIPRAVQN